MREGNPEGPHFGSQSVHPDVSHFFSITLRFVFLASVIAILGPFGALQG